MDLPICTTCGVQRDAADQGCPICLDERQYVGWKGQQWTTLTELRTEHTNEVREEGPGILGIGTRPAFAIGQRALLVDTVLWDCISLIDDDTVAAIETAGGLTAVAPSHPHFYGVMGEYSRAFGDAPIYIHRSDAEWVPRGDLNVVLWEGDTVALGDDLSLVHCGLHFDGGQVLHRGRGDGDLFTGDIFTVVMDRRWVSFMWSYPNLVPERVETIDIAVERVAALPFRTIYGGWWGRIVSDDGPGALRRSAARYKDHL